MGFPLWFSGKEYTCTCRRGKRHRNTGSVPQLGRSPGVGNGNSLQYFLPGKVHGQRSLEGCSPWGSQLVRHDGATEQQSVTHDSCLVTACSSAFCNSHCRFMSLSLAMESLSSGKHLIQTDCRVSSLEILELTENVNT